MFSKIVLLYLNINQVVTMETYLKTLNAHISQQWVSYNWAYFPHNFVNFWDIWIFFFQKDRKSPLF